MPTTAELRERDDADFGHVVLFEGIPIGFTDQRVIADAVTPSSGHTLRMGLLTGHPMSELGGDLVIRDSIDIRDTQFEQNTVRISVHDFEGDLAELFGAEDDDEEQLGLPVYPSDNLAGRAELHGRHVGTEYVGPAGERRQYPVPETATWGLQHFGLQSASDPLGILPAPVTTRPIVWRGRRVAVYRVFRDHITHPTDRTQGWRPWAEAELRWWGTCEDRGTAQGRTWTLDCASRGSWLQKDLGLLTQRTPARAVPDVTLEEEKRGFAGRLWRTGVQFNGQNDPLTPTGTESFGLEDFGATTITGETVAELRESLRAAIVALSSTAGPAGVWNEEGNGVHVNAATGEIGLFVEKLPFAAVNDVIYMGSMVVALHEEMWSALGFDQGQSTLETDDPLYLLFEDTGAAFSLPPIPGYRFAWLTTIPVGHPAAADALLATPPNEIAGIDNGGATRIWRPRFLGGTAPLRHDLQGGQLVRILNDEFAHEGQLYRPVASDPTDPTAPFLPSFNRSGALLFFGKRRFLGEDEEIDEYQVGLCSWNDPPGGFTSGTISSGIFVVHRWLRPRIFGFDRPLMKSDWVVRANVENDDQGLMVVPILILGYRPDSYLDETHEVIQRLLRTTGTATGWDGYHDENPAPGLIGGVNEGGFTFIRHDAEIAELGLGIPSDLIAPPIEWALEADKLPASLRRIKLAVSPGMNTEDVLRGLMQPLGWVWGLRGGRYHVWSPYDTITQDDVEVVLTRRAKRGHASGRMTGTDQALRFAAPIDEFRLDWAWAPHLDHTTHESSHQSPDRGRRYRPGGLPYHMRALGMRDDLGIPPGAWRDRADEIARWWERRHFQIRDWPAMRVPGQDCTIGTVFRLSLPDGADPAGRYGLNGRIGWVVGVEEHIGRGQVKLQLLVQASPTVYPRVHSASARGRGLHEGRLAVDASWLGIDGDTDAPHFLESVYEGLEALGGDARIKWMQWDWEGWDWTGSATVTGFEHEDGAWYLLVTDVVGTYWQDQDTVVVFEGYDNQGAEWVREIHGVVANDDGEFGSGPTPGFKWEA